GVIASLSFRPGGRYLAVGEADRTVTCWDLDADPPRNVPWPTVGGNFVAFAPSGDRVVAGGVGDAKMAGVGLHPLDADGTAGPSVVQGLGGTGLVLAWSADGDRLALGFPNGSVDVHDVAALDRRGAVVPSRRSRFEDGTGRGGANSLAFSPDGRA